MAIHVKPVFSARKQLIKQLRQLLARAAVFTLFSIIASALFLYLQLIFIEQNNEFTFTYVYPQETKEEPPQPEPQKSSSVGGSPDFEAAATISPDIIVSTTADSNSLLTPIEMSMSDGLSPVDSLSFDFGTGLIGDGDGGGHGEGSGQGKGKGSGSGSGGGGGYNDDIQIVLALDASGSMQNLFAAVANSLSDVITTLGQAKLNGKPTKVNIGIVVYGHRNKNGGPFVLSRFTTNVKPLRNKVLKTDCNGMNENCGEAIQLAVRKFPWNMRERDDMLKVIFICGNEPFDMGPVNYKTAISQATASNIIVNTVYCGDEDEQWKQAAELGNGRGLSFYFTETKIAPKEAAQRREQILHELYRIPLLPSGPPATQQHLLSTYKPPTAPPKNKKLLPKWLQNHRSNLINGFEWDCVEYCRRIGPERFNLDHIGGRGNLPISLRSKNNDEALRIIRNAAIERERLLNSYRECSVNEFAETILETLQEQALSKGIHIEL
ncbi:MAG: VWA domain-containing protein [Akkermansia sp.]|nr:VWA domain-containing protein [Akkermansia sp.]